MNLQLDKLQSIKDIESAVIVYEDMLKELINIQDIMIFISKDNKLYSPKYDISIDIHNQKNGILTECFFTKKVHTIKDKIDSFLFNSRVDNQLNFKKNNITTVPILNEDNDILAIIEIFFDKDIDLNEVHTFINLIEDNIKTLSSIPNIFEHIPNILLVSNSLIMIKFLSSILTNYEINTITALNGLEAIEKFKNNRIDVAFIDDVMVGISGFETIHIIREIEIEEDKDSIPIFGITSDTTRESKNKIINSGANSVLEKPVNKDDIIDELKLFMIIE
jgi:CheY-like chemotaxis protein